MAWKSHAIFMVKIRLKSGFFYSVNEAV